MGPYPAENSLMFFAALRRGRGAGRTPHLRARPARIRPRPGPRSHVRLDPAVRRVDDRQGAVRPQVGTRVEQPAGVGWRVSLGFEGQRRQRDGEGRPLGSRPTGPPPAPFHRAVAPEAEPPSRSATSTSAGPRRPSRPPARRAGSSRPECSRSALRCIRAGRARSSRSAPRCHR